MTNLLSRGKKDFSEYAATTIVSGKKTVTVAGTAEQLPSNSIPVGITLIIKALQGNTGKVHVATSQADAEDDNEAYELNAGEIVGLQVTNTNVVWVDANVNGEGVTFIAEA